MNGRATYSQIGDGWSNRARHLTSNALVGSTSANNMRDDAAPNEFEVEWDPSGRTYRRLNQNGIAATQDSSFNGTNTARNQATSVNQTANAARNAERDALEKRSAEWRLPYSSTPGPAELPQISAAMGVSNSNGSSVNRSSPLAHPLALSDPPLAVPVMVSPMASYRSSPTGTAATPTFVSQWPAHSHHPQPQYHNQQQQQQYQQQPNQQNQHYQNEKYVTTSDYPYPYPYPHQHQHQHQHRHHPIMVGCCQSAVDSQGAPVITATTNAPAAFNQFIPQSLPNAPGNLPIVEKTTTVAPISAIAAEGSATERRDVAVVDALRALVDTNRALVNALAGNGRAHNESGERYADSTSASSKGSRKSKHLCSKRPREPGKPNPTVNDGDSIAMNNEDQSGIDGNYDNTHDGSDDDDNDDDDDDDHHDNDDNGDGGSSGGDDYDDDDECCNAGQYGNDSTEDRVATAAPTGNANLHRLQLLHEVSPNKVLKNRGPQETQTKHRRQSNKQQQLQSQSHPRSQTQTQSQHHSQQKRQALRTETIGRKLQRGRRKFSAFTSTSSTPSTSEETQAPQECKGRNRQERKEEEGERREPRRQQRQNPTEETEVAITVVEEEEEERQEDKEDERSAEEERQRELTLCRKRLNAPRMVRAAWWIGAVLIALVVGVIVAFVCWLINSVNRNSKNNDSILCMVKSLTTKQAENVPAATTSVVANASSPPLPWVAPAVGATATTIQTAPPVPGSLAPRVSPAFVSPSVPRSLSPSTVVVTPLAATPRS